MDPATSQAILAVDVADPFDRFVADGSTDLDDLLREAPECAIVMLRADPGTVLTREWRLHSTHLQLTPAPNFSPAPPSVGIFIRAAGPADTPAIRHWLVKAIVEGELARGRHLDRPRVSGVVDGLLRSTRRSSFVIEIDGRASGHVTLVDGEVDPVSGEYFVELFDQLVELEAASLTTRHAASAALVDRAIVHARDLGRPIRGNVVHSVPNDPHDDAVVDRLIESGWTIQYRLWERHIESAEGRADGQRAST